MLAEQVRGCPCFFDQLLRRREFRMSMQAWTDQNTSSLQGKTVAVTGTTGGLGKELCRHLAKLGAALILMDRNPTRSAAFRDELIRDFSVSVTCIGVDLSDFASVQVATERLLTASVDIFIHNAGAYSIPRYHCDTGYDNVFQINFVSPYYMIRTLLPTLRERGGKAVAVGSIAHRYSKIDPNDIDFSTRTQASKVYGNAKRYLIFALHELFAEETEAALSITHPGISFTGITNHYPKVIFALIRYPMKLVFMKPKKACLSILNGVFAETPHNTWIGPRLFDIWGLPKRKFLHISSEEQARIFQRAEQIYQKLLSKAT